MQTHHFSISRFHNASMLQTGWETSVATSWQHSRFSPMYCLSIVKKVRISSGATLSNELPKFPVTLNLQANTRYLKVLHIFFTYCDAVVSYREVQPQHPVHLLQQTQVTGTDLLCGPLCWEGQCATFFLFNTTSRFVIVHLSLTWGPLKQGSLSSEGDYCTFLTVFWFLWLFLSSTLLWPYASWIFPRSH